MIKNPVPTMPFYVVLLLWFLLNVYILGSGLGSSFQWKQENYFCNWFTFFSYLIRLSRSFFYLSTRILYREQQYEEKNLIQALHTIGIVFHWQWNMRTTCFCIMYTKWLYFHSKKTLVLVLEYLLTCDHFVKIMH